MLCTLAQVKDAIGIIGTADDARITALIAEATQTIMRRYGREFVPHTAAATRSFRVRHTLVDLTPFDLRIVTTITLQPGARVLTAADYWLLPIGGMERTGTFTRVMLQVIPAGDVSWLEINGAWGCWADAATVAEDIRRATIETVASWLDRPAASIAGIVELSEPHLQRPSTATSWDIPASAHRKLQMYSRNLGVY